MSKAVSVPPHDSPTISVELSGVTAMPLGNAIPSATLRAEPSEATSAIVPGANSPSGKSTPVLLTPSRSTATISCALSCYGGGVGVEEPDTPSDSPLRLADVMSSAFYGGLMTPQVAQGERAAPFELSTLDGRVVRLADFAGVSPVALVFGSYT